MSKIAVFISKGVVVIVLFLTVSTTVAFSQNVETYDIVSTNGTIIDRSSGRELQIGDKVNFQTELQFNSQHARAVLLNSDKAKYYLELPRASIVSGQLVVVSDLALTPVRSRPALITSTRGILASGLTPENLKKYFAVDTFTIIGDRFTLPVLSRDAELFDLLLRYDSETGVQRYLSTDFTIDRNKLKFQGRGISECFVELVDGDSTLSVTQLSLFFVEKEQLFNEFDAYLRVLNLRKTGSSTRNVLRQYCFDVYGNIDRNSLDTVINEFLDM